nr:MAG TPA: hypothetical protein [Caudoviricetes sp.]
MESKFYGYSIYLDGLDQVAIAEKFCDGFCYRKIMDGTTAVGQVEPVLDNLVAVSGITKGNIEKVADALRRIGFSGPATVYEDWVEGCYCELKNGRSITL